ncbi:MAG TPA: tetratricopeptide repeat protein [Gammaproteobacteria bacterium]|jgi:lipopolysaccharide biosynthesis regulator YciM|nr:tetratricopeptide repeat protein [Gammaproteobacteria bacterium]
MTRSRLLLATVVAALGLGLTTLAAADTILNQGSISSALFRKMRSVQNQIRAGQYPDAAQQLNYLQGVTTNAYEAAVVRELTADLYVARGDFANALSTLQPAVQQNILPGSEQREAQLTLGKLLVANGQYQPGLDMLRNSLQGQENPPPDVLMALAQGYAQSGQCRQAAPEAKRAIDSAADSPSEWYQLLISCLYQEHDYAGAAEQLEAVLSRYPDQTQYWAQLGNAYAQAGDASRALAVYALMYRQGLIRQSQDYLNLASLYAQNSVPYQSALVLQEGLQSGAVAASEANFTLLANAWQDAGDLDRAVAALGEAEKQSKSGDPLVAQAQIYTERHEWFSAIDSAKKAISKGGLKRPGRAWLLQGIAEVQNRQYDEGTAALREAAKYDESRAQAEAWLHYLSVRNSG